MNSLLDFCRWLGDTQGSIALHESIWVYPIVESVHVLTLCVFLGLTVMLDLRLLGATLLATPVSRVIQRLMPWMIAGFVVMLTTGALLFYADPVRTWFNIFFRVKVAFLMAAGLNAGFFHLMTSRTLRQWDLDAKPPFGARLAGGLSLAFWATVVVCGRMIAYHWFDQDPTSLAG